MKLKKKLFLRLLKKVFLCTYQFDECRNRYTKNICILNVKSYIKLLRYIQIYDQLYITYIECFIG